jgi:hypothetical protein
VPFSLLNPEGEIPMFCVSYGVTAIFAMIPKFEESAKKSAVLASSTRNSGNKGLLTTESSALSRKEQNREHLETRRRYLRFQYGCDKRGHRSVCSKSIK